MYPDAAMVGDDTPGGTPKAQLAVGARELARDLALGSRRLLITFAGIPKITGAPLRALCPGEGLEADKMWLVNEARRRAYDASKLFAHLGLPAVSEVGAELMGPDVENYAASAETFPESNPQV